MRIARRPILVAAAGVLAVLAAALGWFVATFDPNAYKALLVDHVRSAYGRTLDIPGPVALRVFPTLAVRVGPASLSAQGGSQPFASVQSARASIALLPLLRGRVVADALEVQGLRVAIVRAADGTTSIDDLLGRSATAPADTSDSGDGAGPRHDIGGIRIDDGSIVLEDRRGGRRVTLSGLALEAGRIAPGTASPLRASGRIAADRPQLDGAFTLSGEVRLDPAGGASAVRALAATYAGPLATLADGRLRLVGEAEVATGPLRLDLHGIDLTLQGSHPSGVLDARLQVPQLRLGDTAFEAQQVAASASIRQPTRTLRVRLSVPALGGTPDAFRAAALEGELGIVDGALDATATLRGALEGGIARRVVASPQSTLSISGRNGTTAIKGTLATPWTLDLAAGTLALPGLDADFVLPGPAGGTLALQARGSATARLDAERVQAKLAGRLDESRFDGTLEVGLDPPALAFDIDIDRLDLDRYRRPDAAADAAAIRRAEAGPDLSLLERWTSTGHLDIGTLKAAGLRATDVRLDVRAGAGRLAIERYAAAFYGGRAAGALSMQATRPPRYALQQTLTGVRVGPLLQAAIGKASLEGRGSVAIDVTAQGAGADALQRSLGGTVRVDLRDGVVRGVDLVQAIRAAATQLRAAAGSRGGTASAGQASDFSELSGTFRIAGGIARNDDLVARSALLRARGKGEIDWIARRLDYVVSAEVGAGEPALRALRGRSIPVRLTGPFDAIAWRVDVETLVQDLARQELEKQARKAAEKIQDRLGEKLLKGLFGR